MQNRSRPLDLDWVVISKSRLYGLVTATALAVLACFAGLYVWIYGNPFARDPSQVVPTGASFYTVEGDVRVVRAQTREVVRAGEDTRVMPGDLVQTEDGGRARLTLADGSTLLVNPNSVVTLGDNARADDGRHSQVRVAVESGQIRMRTDEQPAGASSVVETPLTRSRLAASTAASFGVRRDRTEEMGVSEGQLSTTTRAGEATTVRAGEYVAVASTGKVQRREALLDEPVQVSPPNPHRVAAQQGGSAVVRLRWTRPLADAAAYYRVEIARSPFFVRPGMVFERDWLEHTELLVSTLAPGAYFWRVQAVSRSGQASEWASPHRLDVVPWEPGSAPAAGAPNEEVRKEGGRVERVPRRRRRAQSKMFE